MRVYIGNDKVKGVMTYAVTVYKDNGSVLYSATKKEKEDGLERLEYMLRAVLWGTKRFKSLTVAGQLDETESIILFVRNKQVLDCIEKEDAASQFLNTLGSLLLEIRFLYNPCEIIVSQDKTKVKYENIDPSEEDATSVSRLFT